MSVAFTFLLAFSLMSGQPQGEIERLDHEHSVYVLKGSPEQLQRFQKQLAKRWEGGRLLHADSKNGRDHYLAFAWRTAPQARQFLMPAAFSGMKLEIKEYIQEDYFPVERAYLDRVVSSCGSSIDAFMVLGARSIQVNLAKILAQSPDENPAATCILEAIRDEAFFHERNLGFVGNEQSSKRESD